RSDMRPSSLSCFGTKQNLERVLIPYHMGTAGFICSACLHERGSFLMQRSEYAVVRCAQCGLAHLLPRPESAEDSHQLNDLRYYNEVMRRLRPGLDYHSTK